MSHEDISGFRKICNNTLYVLSTIVTIGAICLCCYGIGSGYAALDGHPVVLFIVFIIVVTLLAYLEGLQIAIMELQNEDRNAWRYKPRAFNNHKLATANSHLNVQRFLVGRQFFVVFVVFLAAQLTTYSDLEVPWLPNWLFIVIIQTGLPGVLWVLSFGQLMPQLIASTHPVVMLDLPGSWSVIQMALMFESMGVTHFSWVLTLACKHVFNLNTPDIQTWSREVSRNRSALGKSRENSRNASKIIPYITNNFNSFITRETLDVKIVEHDALYQEASTLEAISPADKSQMLNLNYLSDESVNNVFQRWNFPVNKEGYPKESYPVCEDIVRHLARNNQEVPVYLLPPSHPRHIPSYIVVMELQRLEQERKNRTVIQN